MALLLFSLAVMTGAAGFYLLKIANGALHEIEGLIILLGSAIFLGSSFIVAALHKNDRRVVKELRSIASAVRAAQRQDPSRAADGLAALSDQAED